MLGLLQVRARIGLVQGLIQGEEPSLKGLAVHRLRQEAAAAWPAPGASPSIRSFSELLGSLHSSHYQWQSGSSRSPVALGDSFRHRHLVDGTIFATGPVGWMLTGMYGAGGLPTEAWEAVRDVLMPDVKACLLPGSQTGWHDAGDACLNAEPICEALSLYHLLLSREAQQGQSLTGLS